MVYAAKGSDRNFRYYGKGETHAGKQEQKGGEGLSHKSAAYLEQEAHYPGGRKRKGLQPKERQKGIPSDSDRGGRWNFFFNILIKTLLVLVFQDGQYHQNIAYARRVKISIIFSNNQPISAPTAGRTRFPLHIPQILRPLRRYPAR